MSHLLTSGQVGNIGMNHMKAIRQEIQTKWNSLGFLDGLKGHVRENVATLYENQATTLLSEATTATNSGSFETVVFPIVRRVFSKLLANDIVSVQAMNMPIGKLFFFVPLTSSRVNEAGVAGNPYTTSDSTDVWGANAQYSAHTGMAAQGIPSCVVGASCVVTPFLAKNMYDIFYNDGLFDNSKGTLTIQVKTPLPVFTLGTDGTFTIVNTSGAVLPLATDGSVRNVIVAISGFTPGASLGNGREVMTGADGNQMDTESFLASLHVTAPTTLLDKDGNAVTTANKEVPFRLVTQQYGRGIVDKIGALTDAGGACWLSLDLSHPVGIGGASTYDGYIGASATTYNSFSGFSAAWAQYATLELETEMGEVSFKLDEVVVSVEERKLRATWSPELAQDVSAFHNIDAEAELTAMLSEQVAAEIDREILRDLRKAAAWQLRWDYNGWRKSSSVANPYTQKDWNQTLITKVNQLSAQIHKSTIRGGANFIVLSSEISAIFDDLEYFHVSDANPESDQYNMGIERIGTLSGRYQVYRDPYAPAYSIIIGHKGKSLLDTGYIYAPYVPLQLTPTMYNPFNFAPVKGIMTRYAKKVVNNRFYAAIRVDGVPTFNINELR
jgi:hypothetical protein